MPRNKEKE
jgi:hypothetical protein